MFTIAKRLEARTRSARERVEGPKPIPAYLGK